MATNDRITWLEESNQSTNSVLVKASIRRNEAVVDVKDIQVWHMSLESRFLNPADIIAKANGNAKLASAALLATGVNTRVIYIRE